MVKVREEHPIREDGSIDISLWLERLTDQSPHINADDIAKACDLIWQTADMVTQQTEEAEYQAQDSFLMGLEMAQILSELQQDHSSILAGLLYRSVHENKLALNVVETQFGQEVVQLLHGVLQMDNIGLRKNPRLDTAVLGNQTQQVDNLRKMLVAMIDDVRVALLKIVERTCVIRRVKDASRKKRYMVAKEVAEIYAPLAHRLGIGHIKWELEDLSFRYLKPNDYKNIAHLLDEKRLDRQVFINKVVNELRQQLEVNDISGDVQGRAKHIYSIWRKMQNKNIEFNQVYDVRAVRVLVPEIKDCYAVLGIVHGLWRNIPHEFDDYIASPKPNGYRSLHTAVFGPEGRVLEIQIRTFAMHDEAELGVCAHHIYKGTDTKARKDGYEEKIAWLRQVLEWHDKLGDSTAIEDVFNSDIAQDRIYVFTPDGHVIDMSVASTPIDFAYRIHTEVGHRCNGAKINGRIVPLNRTLKTGDQVQILTAKDPQPRRDWLNPNLGYVNSSRARASIAHWFKMQNREHNLEAGQLMLDRELRRLALNSGEYDWAKIVDHLNFKTLDDVHAALGAGDLRLSQVISQVQKQSDALNNQQLGFEFQATQPSTKSSTFDAQERGQGIHIQGVGNLLTTLANCCKPVPGDPIEGFITQGRGVSIHHINCSNLQQLRTTEPQRIITVDWDEQNENTYPVDILIEAYDRTGLLKDVMFLMAQEKINITSMNTKTDAQTHVAKLFITIEISRLDRLGRLMDKLNQLPNVFDVNRKRDRRN